MIYLYNCTSCNKQSTIDKPMQESNRLEYCKICKSELKRVFTSSTIKTSDGVKVAK